VRRYAETQRVLLALIKLLAEPPMLDRSKGKYQTKWTILVFQIRDWKENW
jgi:hypothetical protein